MLNNLNSGEKLAKIKVQAINISDFCNKVKTLFNEITYISIDIEGGGVDTCSVIG